MLNPGKVQMLIAWVNGILKTNLTSLNDFKGGQVLHRLLCLIDAEQVKLLPLQTYCQRIKLGLEDLYSRSLESKFSLEKFEDGDDTELAKVCLLLLVAGLLNDQEMFANPAIALDHESQLNFHHVVNHVLKDNRNLDNIDDDYYTVLFQNYDLSCKIPVVTSTPEEESNRQLTSSTPVNTESGILENSECIGDDVEQSLRDQPEAIEMLHEVQVKKETDDMMRSLEEKLTLSKERISSLEGTLALSRKEVLSLEQTVELLQNRQAQLEDQLKRSGEEILALKEETRSIMVQASSREEKLQEELETARLEHLEAEKKSEQKLKDAILCHEKAEAEREERSRSKKMEFEKKKEAILQRQAVFLQRLKNISTNVEDLAIKKPKLDIDMKKIASEKMELENLLRKRSEEIAELQTMLAVATNEKKGLEQELHEEQKRTLDKNVESETKLTDTRSEKSQHHESEANEMGTTMQLEISRLSKVEDDYLKSIESLQQVQKELLSTQQSANHWKESYFKLQFSLCKKQKFVEKSSQEVAMLENQLHQRSLCTGNPLIRSSSSSGLPSFGADLNTDSGTGSLPFETNEPEEFDGGRATGIQRQGISSESYDDAGQVAELQRRNTLCPPHLRSIDPGCNEKILLVDDFKTLYGKRMRDAGLTSIAQEAALNEKRKTKEVEATGINVVNFATPVPRERFSAQIGSSQLSDLSARDTVATVTLRDPSNKGEKPVQNC